MAHRVWRTIAIFAVASLLAGSASFAQRPTFAAHAKQLTFYLIPGISTDAFYITMHVGARAAARSHGINLVFQGNPNAFSAPTQIPILNAAIARHPDAILIAPTDKVALIAPITRAIKAGIPVILVDTTINTPNIAVTSISSNNVLGGQKAATALANAIGRHGTVGAVSVQPGISTTDQRKQGFEQRLKAYPKIKYIGIQYDNDSPTTAATEASAMITAHSDLSGIFAMNTNSGIGVTNAAEHAGKKIKLVEFDAEPVQVQALRAGTITALVAQDPFSIGEMAVNIAYKWVTGHRHGIKKHYGTGEAIITKANVNSPAYKHFLYTRNG